MGEIIRLNVTEKNKIDVAFGKIENGDVTGGVSMLLNAANDGASDEVYYHLGVIYNEIGLYDYSLNNFYRYLGTAGKHGKCRAYNGIASCFVHLGNNELASYYYDRQLAVSKTLECDFEDDMYDFFDFMVDKTRDKSNFRIIDDEEEYSNALIKGKKLMADEDYDGALKMLDRVPMSSKSYTEAATNCAICYFMQDKIDGAIYILQDLIAGGKADFSAYENIVNMLYASDRTDEAEAYAREMCKIKTDDLNDEVRAVVALCNLSMDKEIEKKTAEILKDNPYFVSVYTVRGIALYNLGKYKESYNILRKNYLLTRNEIAFHYLLKVQAVMDGKAEYTPFKYARDFKNEAFVQKVVRIESWSKMPLSALKKESKDELFSTCEWCIDVQSPTLVTSVCAVIARLNSKKTNEFLANLLCRVDIAENAKTFIIYLLVKNGYDKTKGVVFADLYMPLKFYKAEFDGDDGRFSEAYAYAFSKIAPLVGDKSKKLRECAYEYFNRFHGDGIDDKIDGYQSLATAIVLDAGLNPVKNKNSLYKYFGANKSQVLRLQKLFMGVDDENN